MNVKLKIMTINTVKFLVFHLVVKLTVNGLKMGYANILENIDDGKFMTFNTGIFFDF